MESKVIYTQVQTKDNLTIFQCNSHSETSEAFWMIVDCFNEEHNIPGLYSYEEYEDSIIFD